MNEQAKNNNKSKKYIARAVIGCIVVGGIAVGSSKYKIYKDNNFKRVVTEEGEYDLENFISYDNLISYELVEVKTITGDNKLFIAKEDSFKLVGTYNDIFSGKVIAEDNADTEIVNVGQISDYLIAYDMIKARYFKEDIETLLDKIEEDYVIEKDKTLVKEWVKN